MTNLDNRSEAALNLIVALEEDQQVSQTKLAKRLGIAVGLVNILMKRAVKSGAIKIKQIPGRRYSYYLTPNGFAEKAMLVTHKSCFPEHSNKTTTIRSTLEIMGM